MSDFARAASRSASSPSRPGRRTRRSSRPPTRARWTLLGGHERRELRPGVTGTALSSYAAGELILEASRFSSRGSATNPTFHSGGASPNDPVGNPGSPIGIITPSGAIGGDVESGENVAAPLVIFTDEPWNDAFMEVIFFPGNVERVGFWVTHGPVRLDLRDRSGTTSRPATSR